MFKAEPGFILVLTTCLNSGKTMKLKKKREYAGYILAKIEEIKYKTQFPLLWFTHLRQESKPFAQ